MPRSTEIAATHELTIARIAAVFSLACGAVIDWAICRYQGKGQSELGLLRLLDKFNVYNSASEAWQERAAA